MLLARFRCEIIITFSFVFIFFTCVLYVSLSCIENNKAKRRIEQTREGYSFDKDAINVVVVDQHQEIIPYWYEAAGFGLIERNNNVLIHIDAHADFAPPADFSYLMTFDSTKSPKLNDFLPLMQVNDAFIISSMIHGLFNSIIWVLPSWSNEYSSIVNMAGNIGHLIDKSGICYSSSIQSEGIYVTEYFVLDRDSGDQVSINKSDCLYITPFNLTIIPDNKKRVLKNIFQENKYENIFLDIDEDFFGVESGVQRFIDLGLSLENIKTANNLFKELFCPENVEEEERLNNDLKDMFSKLHNHMKNKSLSTLISEHHFVEHLLRNVTKNQKCEIITEKILELQQTANYIAGLEMSVIEGFSRIIYCNINSPILESFKQQFGLCHGSNFPEETLNQYYVADAEGLRKRGYNLAQIFASLFKNNIPKFCGIARSARDGYIPRSQQYFVENVILIALQSAGKMFNKELNVYYDKNLLFGKKGWG